MEKKSLYQEYVIKIHIFAKEILKKIFAKFIFLYNINMKNFFR